MDIPRELREELKKLSKEVFGVSSKWQKMLEGQSVLLTRKTTEVVPAEEGKEATTKEVEVPVLTSYGAKQFVMKYLTVEEVHTKLLEFKKQLDAMREQIKQQQEEKKAKEAEELALKNLKESAQGSAVV